MTSDLPQMKAQPALIDPFGNPKTPLGNALEVYFSRSGKAPRQDLLSEERGARRRIKNVIKKK